MSTSKPRVTIVGLGLIGGSLGLALRQADAASVIIGHDRARDAGGQAKRLGAVDKAHWNLVSACENSDLVILATPVGAIEDTLQAIGPSLRPGCVVMDTAAAKRSVLGWAAEHLPESVSFVGSNPILSAASDGRGGLEAARADLFQDGLICIVPAPGADGRAVKLVTDLVRVLGARPLFLDAVEHDGLVAAVDHLPPLLALALSDVVVQQPTWRELRKMAGPSFETGTALLATDPAIYTDLWTTNRDNVLRWLDAFSDSLALIRRALAEGEADALVERWQTALAERQSWLAERATGQWLESPRPEMPSRSFIVDSFFGSLLRRKPKRDS